MQRFTEKSPLTAVVLTFNYILFLPPGVSLAGTPVVTFMLNYGDDSSPAALSNGPPAIGDWTDTNGIVHPSVLVLQPVAGGIDMNDYIVTASCLTTSQYWAPALPAILPVRLFPSKCGAP
jgi:hypothetical protein